MTQNNYRVNKRSKWVKIMATILAIAVGGSIFFSMIALIIAGL